MSDPVRFDTRVAVVVREDLRPWQELNVTAFLMSAISTSEPGLTGETYRDADGNAYLAMLRQPVMILVASGEGLAGIRAKALARELPLAIYTGELFSTGDDAANRAAVAAVPADRLDLVGVAVRGPRNAVDRMLKGAGKHS